MILFQFLSQKQITKKYFLAPPFWFLFDEMQDIYFNLS